MHAIHAVLLILAAISDAKRLQIAPFGPAMPAPTFHTASSDQPSFLALDTSSSLNPFDVALEFAKTRLNLSDGAFVVKDHYLSEHNGVTHVYLKQVVHGLEVVNGDVNINVDANGSIVTAGHNLWRGNDEDVDLPSFTPFVESTEEERPLYRLDRIREKGKVTDGIWNWFLSGVSWLSSGDELPAGTRSVTEKKQKSQLSPKRAFQHLSAFLGQEVQPESSLHLHVENSLVGDPQFKLVGSKFTVSSVPLRPAYLMTDHGQSLKLVWDFQTEMTDNWFHAHVDAFDGSVLQLIDWVTETVPFVVQEVDDAASAQPRVKLAPPSQLTMPARGSTIPLPVEYTVYPFGINDPLEGDRQVIRDPADPVASPNGWHDAGFGRMWNDTRGNNVAASANIGASHGDWDSGTRPNGVADSNGRLLFNFALDLKQAPSTYVDAAVTNLFYWNNIMHDVTYKYGFTEKAGNFQENNLGRGGRDGDGVIASAQDAGGFNNANFATPPDGGRGRMRMYVWNTVTPYRDGDLESGIIVHEYTHGVTIRMTGGPSNSGCLPWGESGGMGEGWGDFLATIFRMRPEYKRDKVFAMGEYANGGRGIRKFPYSTSKDVNPETYGVMDGAAYFNVHAKGAVWANMLYEMYWNLVDKLGFTSDWYSGSTKHGNTLALQIVMDGLTLQPCLPNFTDARDAILAAERTLTGGAHQCEIWKAFARRGLGVGAKLLGAGPFGGRRVESSKLPDECPAA